MASLLAGADTMVRLPFSPSVSSLMGGVMHRGVQGSLSPRNGCLVHVVLHLNLPNLAQDSRTNALFQIKLSLWDSDLRENFHLNWRADHKSA